jgi:hypothetical protein
MAPRKMQRDLNRGQGNKETRKQENKKAKGQKRTRKHNTL